MSSPERETSEGAVDGKTTARERLVAALMDLAKEADQKARDAETENRRLHGAYIAAEAAVRPAQEAWARACGRMQSAQHEATRAWERVAEARRGS